MKPRHLGAEYAAQFADEEVAAAYRYRPPYPPETFAIVERLLGPPRRDVLELGAGTGDFTIGLAPRVDRLIAVEPSRARLEAGRARAFDERLRSLVGPYCAGDSVALAVRARVTWARPRARQPRGRKA